MRDIKDLNLQELEVFLEAANAQAFRSRQVFDWIYKRGVADFSRMTNLPQDIRRRLAREFSVLHSSIIAHLVSADGTEKFLFALEDGNHIEAVSIPAAARVTACLSSQVGCRLGCRFCASGLGGFKRDLTCGEILEELFRLKNDTRLRQVTHVVFMGTGEPLDNYDNVLKAIRIINSQEGYGIGARRITISTGGIIPGIERLATEGLQVELSVSLHAADEALRSRIMPVNKKYPLGDLIKACRHYYRATGRQVTFEYILMEGVNSDLLNARKLGTILQGFDCKVNLIAANPVEELRISAPPVPQVKAFKNELVKAGVRVTVRASRGQDIQAACGQLRLRYVQQ
jgi:23S rRNA (adenine2503-C2)-methyltransferase